MMRETRPLNIAMVAACPFPANHGSPASIREMAEAVAARGHRVHVVTYHFGDAMPVKNLQIHRIVDAGFQRHMVVGPTWQKPLLDLCMVLTLCRVIQREAIDLIHAHNYEGVLIGYLARLLTRKPLLYHAINTMSDELSSYNFIKPRFLATWLARCLDHWAPRTADQIIVISEELRRFLRARAIAADRLHLIPLGIDPTPFEAPDASLIRHRYPGAGKRLVVYSGILDRLQRLDYLLKAMRLVVNTFSDAHLLLVANLVKAPDVQVCQRMIEDLGLQDHVDMVAPVSFAELPPFLAAAEVTVVCRPHCPGVPVKLLNYLAAGKPCVVFEGSAKGLQHMQHAFVVPDHDWSALGHGIMTLLHDPERAAALGQGGKQWVSEQLHWPRLVERIEHVYNDLLEGR